jgi:queuine tRNA-ribosyltransferase
MFSFTITHTDSTSAARTGLLATPHGTLETPNFIFCATKAAIKGLGMEAVRRAGADIILSNTYHLMLQPGAATVEKLGGLHKMMQWDGPLLTDSGGYQVFSMAWGGISEEIQGLSDSGAKGLRGKNKNPSTPESFSPSAPQPPGSELKGGGRGSRPNTVLAIDEDGVTFRSYLDGQRIRMTPESAMLLQRKLGADLVMAFDECTAFGASRDYTEKALARSNRWGLRSLEAFTKLNRDGRQALYGIVQGAHYRELREAAMQAITRENYFGTAIGGSFGASKADLYAILEWCRPLHKRERPVHLLGVGDIGDIFKGVRAGVDTFDCVQPTRLARHGQALMPGEPGGRINFRNARFREDTAPLDPEKHHAETAVFSRGYLHHLVKAGEMLGVQILAEHNIAVMTRLMREIRAAIAAGKLDAVEARWTANLDTDEERTYGENRVISDA